MRALLDLTVIKFTASIELMGFATRAGIAVRVCVAGQVTRMLTKL